MKSVHCPIRLRKAIGLALIVAATLVALACALLLRAGQARAGHHAPWLPRHSESR